MTIDDDDQLERLRAAGLVVRAALDAMEAACEPGITTDELDAIGRAVGDAAGARSAPQLAYDFPGWSCISVNHEAVHGIPGLRVVEAGDLVKIDVTAELDGYMADACITVAVPPVSDRMRLLHDTAQRALDLAIAQVVHDAPINEIGRAIETEVRDRGLRVMRELGGHGIGRVLHEAPRVESWYDPRDSTRMHDGMVFTIEPIISESSERTVTEPDGWTLVTHDGSWAAQFEHTLVVNGDEPIVLTA